MFNLYLESRNPSSVLQKHIKWDPESWRTWGSSPSNSPLSVWRPESKKNWYKIGKISGFLRREGTKKWWNLSFKLSLVSHSAICYLYRSLKVEFWVRINTFFSFEQLKENIKKLCSWPIFTNSELQNFTYFQEIENSTVCVF